MTETPTPPRRRWFQFSLGEILILGPLLAIIWWQAVTWKVDEWREPRPVGQWELNDQGEVSAVDIIGVGIDMRRPPTLREVVLRAGPTSIGLIVIWNAARFLIHSYQQRRTLRDWMKGMKFPRFAAARTLGSIALLAVAAAILFVGYRNAIDSEGFIAIDFNALAIAGLGIIVFGAAIGYFVGKPISGAAVGLVLSSMAFITLWVRCAMVLID